MTFPPGDSAEEILLRQNLPHRIALTFLLLFLSRKKVKEEKQKRDDSPIIPF
jgi:hypothetical protein